MTDRFPTMECECGFITYSAKREAICPKCGRRNTCVVKDDDPYWIDLLKPRKRLKG